ncbi:MAG: hypothetical protein AB1659_00850 [Thermodesulfobacteriota bacterium]
MPVKFNQYWTVDHSKVKEYEKFIIDKFVPGINRLGIHTVAGWCILVGGYTEIIFEGVSNDLELLEKALRNPEYKVLNHELQNYIKRYKTKVLVNTGRKESYSIDVKESTIKFNQVWDVDSRKKDGYEKYVSEEFYPCLEKLGITVAGEWEVLIGDGPHIICEGRAQEINRLVENLQSKTFRMARLGLKQFIENYESRILVFHIQKVHGYKSSSYNIVAA